MKKMLTLLALGLSLSLGVAHAAEEKTKQQTKMAACNADEKAKTLKGDERKAFMKECLGAKPEATPASAACEKSAADKKLAGAAKNSHIKKCMAEAAPAAAPAAAPVAAPAAATAPKK